MAKKKHHKPKFNNYHIKWSIDAGWYAGEDWTLFAMTLLKPLFGIQYIILFHFSFLKFGIGLGFEWYEKDILEDQVRDDL